MSSYLDDFDEMRTVLQALEPVFNRMRYAYDTEKRRADNWERFARHGTQQITDLRLRLEETKVVKRPNYFPLETKIEEALEIIERFGGIDGEHHKTWVIDQVARKLLGERYAEWVIDQKDGEDGPNTYDWNEGIPP